MEIVKRYFKAGYRQPVVVIVEEFGGYGIHRLYGPGYLLRGVFKNLDECLERAGRITEEY